MLKPTSADGSFDERKDKQCQCRKAEQMRMNALTKYLDEGPIYAKPLMQVITGTQKVDRENVEARMMEVESKRSKCF